MGQCNKNNVHRNIVIASSIMTNISYDKINRIVYVKYCLNSNGVLDMAYVPRANKCMMCLRL